MGFDFLGFFLFMGFIFINKEIKIHNLCWVLILRVVLSKMVLFSMDFRSDAYFFVMVASK